VGIIAKQRAGNRNLSTTKTVIDKIPAVISKVDKVTSTTTKVTGKSESNVVIYIYNGKNLIGKATATSKGTFSVNIAKQIRVVSYKYMQLIKLEIKVYLKEKRYNNMIARIVDRSSIILVIFFYNKHMCLL